MIQSLLQDAALSAAKERSHAKVEPRHVLYAIARQFRSRPEVQELLPLAKSALEPYGSSHQLPEVTAEARALIESLSSESAALAALVAAFKPKDAPKGRTSGVVAAPPQVQQETKASPDTARKPEEKKETAAAVLAELEALTGLESVKQQLRRISAVVQANEERKRAGLATVNPGLHLVFTGPPGTGKTTVARLVARLYAAVGALPGSNFTEASRADLVAGYVGQTAIKTGEVITRTRPGVLFIDEAYSLTPHHDSDFGAEAIAALVKAMEDYRHELAVIVAGYGDEMSDFVASNPGLRSRFKTYVAFPNYEPEELSQIFAGFARDAAIALGSGVAAKAESIFRGAAEKPGFGNARFARSLFEEAYARMSARAAADGEVKVEELVELIAEDVHWQDGTPERVVRRIGFGGE